MARSDRKLAANRFRVAIARSNALHAEYLGDAGLLASYDRFTRWQLDYMLAFFADLIEGDDYTDAVDFIVGDLAGVGIAERDREIERAAGVIVNTLPVHPLESAVAALELNASVLEINLAIWRELFVDGQLPATLAEIDYVTACRTASSYDACMNLVHLAGELGHTLKDLVRIPLIGGLLRTMRGPAHAAGFGTLQEFLETGFTTFRRIPDIDQFLDQLTGRLDVIFGHVYKKPLSAFRKG